MKRHGLEFSAPKNSWFRTWYAMVVEPGHLQRAGLDVWSLCGQWPSDRSPGTHGFCKPEFFGQVLWGRGTELVIDHHKSDAEDRSISTLQRG